MSSANSLPRPHRHNSIETLSRTTLVCERAWRARRPNPTEDQRWLPQAVRSRQRYLTACSLAACSAQLHHQSGRDRSGRPRQPAEEAHSYEFRWPRSQPSIEVLWRAALFTGDKPSMEYGERHDAHPDHDHTGRAAGAAPPTAQAETRSASACSTTCRASILIQGPVQLYVFDVARARASPTSRLGHSRYSSPSLRRPLCVRRGSRGLKNRTGPLSHYMSANRWLGICFQAFAQSVHQVDDVTRLFFRLRSLDGMALGLALNELP